MYRFHAKYFLPVLLTSLTVSGAFGQTSTISDPLAGRENDPYSRFGIGRLTNGNNTVLQGMGDMTSAFENPYEVNTDNPASYSFLKLTTYEAGANGSFRNVATNDLSYGTGTATLSYLNIGIPVSKNAAICIGLRPYSHMYYNLVDTLFYSPGSPVNKTAYAYSGDGALNYAFLGAAARYKGFSAGFNLGYMFGTLRRTAEAINIDDSITTAYNSDFSQYLSVGSLYWKAGLMYEDTIKEDLIFRVGGTFTLSQNLNAKRNEYWIGTYDLGDTTIQDTAYSAAESRAKIKLPLSYSLGFQVGRLDKWLVGVDYSASNWTQFNNYPGVDSTQGNGYVNSYKIALGGEFTPNFADRNYWSRVTYRAGVYYGTDYITVNGSTLSYYGLTLGTSLPIKRSTSHVHAAVDIGRLGTKSNGLIQESYVRFTLGLSFNDRWFIKRKYD